MLLLVYYKPECIFKGMEVFVYNANSSDGQNKRRREERGGDSLKV